MGFEERESWSRSASVGVSVKRLVGSGRTKDGGARGLPHTRLWPNQDFIGVLKSALVLCGRSNDMRTSFWHLLQPQKKVSVLGAPLTWSLRGAVYDVDSQAQALGARSQRWPGWLESAGCCGWIRTAASTSGRQL